MSVGYQLFVYMIHGHDHHKAVLVWNKKKYVYYGSTFPKLTTHKPQSPAYRVSSIWFIKVP